MPERNKKSPNKETLIKYIETKKRKRENAHRKKSDLQQSQRNKRTIEVEGLEKLIEQVNMSALLKFKNPESVKKLAVMLRRVKVKGKLNT